MGIRHDTTPRMQFLFAKLSYDASKHQLTVRLAFCSRNAIYALSVQQKLRRTSLGCLQQHSMALPVAPGASQPEMWRDIITTCFRPSVSAAGGVSGPLPCNTTAVADLLHGGRVPARVLT
jgi:hypothetical protein